MTDLRTVAARPPWFLRHPLPPEDASRLLELPERLRARIIGQDDAIAAATQPIVRVAAGLHDPERPVASCLFAGPTGTGKTELVRALAEELYGSAGALLRLDMAEYHDRYSVGRLFGAPPGYVGYDDGGQLTNFLAKNPYGVVLFDEIEKADRAVFDPFLQMLDAGRLTDGQGRVHRCTGTIMVLTSNAGTSDLRGVIDDPEAMARTIQEALQETFRPEFLNRLDAITMFRPLSPEALARVVQLQLAPLVERARKRGIDLQVSPAALEALRREGYDPLNGARPLRRLIEKGIADLLADGVVRGVYREREVLTVDHDGDAFLLRQPHAPVRPALEPASPGSLPPTTVAPGPSDAAVEARESAASERAPTQPPLGPDERAAARQRIRELLRQQRAPGGTAEEAERTQRIRALLHAPGHRERAARRDRIAQMLQRQPGRAPPDTREERAPRTPGATDEYQEER